ncbi:MAG: 2,3-bisphosphoglycerate-dependent phosphoglycerate mutase [Bacteroidales bacterium]|nr:2,3-bisphosphoglycerate-dependent phosphoglycerate mutase [Bacteroidales bacterium]
MKSIILVRHGESWWNREGRLTGWTNIGLTPEGEMEAISAATKLINNGYIPEKAFCSYLDRSYRTLEIMLGALSLKNIPVERYWQLNENHYGQLQGMLKEDVYRIHGKEMAELWFSSYEIAPPPIEPHDVRNPCYNHVYSNIATENLPIGESYSELATRVISCWKENILPALNFYDCIMVVAHGNSLREIIKEWCQIDKNMIFKINLASASPVILHID